jgi:hypothetical protein
MKRMNIYKVLTTINPQSEYGQAFVDGVRFALKSLVDDTKQA